MFKTQHFILTLVLVRFEILHGCKLLLPGSELQLSTAQNISIYFTSKEYKTRLARIWYNSEPKVNCVSSLRQTRPSMDRSKQAQWNLFAPHFEGHWHSEKYENYIWFLSFSEFQSFIFSVHWFVMKLFNHCMTNDDLQEELHDMLCRGTSEYKEVMSVTHKINTISIHNKFRNQSDAEWQWLIIFFGSD